MTTMKSLEITVKKFGAIHKRDKPEGTETQTEGK